MGATPALVAEAAAAEPSDKWSLWREMLGAGPIVFVLFLGLVFAVWAIAIHIASGVTNLPNRSFGRACKGAAIAMVLSLLVPFLFGFIMGLLGVTSQTAIITAYIASAILPGTLAIRNAYEAGFVSSLVTYIVCAIVTILLGAGAFFALKAAIGN